MERLEREAVALVLDRVKAEKRAGRIRAGAVRVQVGRCRWSAAL